jgi:hypothetical protein
MRLALPMGTMNSRKWQFIHQRVVIHWAEPRPAIRQGDKRSDFPARGKREKGKGPPSDGRLKKFRAYGAYQRIVRAAYSSYIL